MKVIPNSAMDAVPHRTKKPARERFPIHLLIVDDEPIIRLGLKKMAEAYMPSFADIRTAENGVDALGKIAAREPNIVISDIRMPKMDGLALCQTIHHHHAHIQTVVVSGYNDFEYAQKCISYGVKHYLLKPVPQSTLHEVFDAMLKKEAPGYIPVTRYVQWIDCVEQCIWTLQTDELNRLMEEWKDYCLQANLSFHQLHELLNECMDMLLKRFQVRHFIPTITMRDIPEGNITIALEAFDDQLRQIEGCLRLSRNGNYKDAMQLAKNYMDDRLSQELSLDEVAKMAGLTPTYFSLLFKKMTNQTFVQYRINKRMAMAKELLGVPHLKIVDIADEVGYDDYSHFTKTFKKVVGISPSEFRSSLGIK
ncbi:response regulator [Paenibacillus sp. HWE-109]|uniref:response regulator transcription factor n=1 Tax=Paenibacillus sp. HWE-109 TaxID=1306526 RepID=UPI001EDD8F8B|nr:response regulator [Paenibacillus sp. HWE-109]UKS28509.1 response regulator [Paenibacillus sp. HWE-109]